MVCSKVVNLFLINCCPKVFADKFHGIQLIFKPRAIFGEPASVRKLEQSLTTKLEVQYLHSLHPPGNAVYSTQKSLQCTCYMGTEICMYFWWGLSHQVMTPHILHLSKRHRQMFSHPLVWVLPARKTTYKHKIVHNFLFQDQKRTTNTEIFIRSQFLCGFRIVWRIGLEPKK